MRKGRASRGGPTVRQKQEPNLKWREVSRPKMATDVQRGRALQSGLENSYGTDWRTLVSSGQQNFQEMKVKLAVGQQGGRRWTR